MGYQKVKTQQWKEQEKDSSDYCSAEKKGAFFRQKKRYCVKCAGKSNAGGKSRKGLIV
jgi:hypothetical protein